MSYVNIKSKDMEMFLDSLGFKEIQLEGTKERTFAKRIDREGKRLSLRVYTGIVGDDSRGCGEDAIRLCLFHANSSGDIRMCGVQKRVNRVPGWEDRLLERIDNWEELLPVAWCDKCESPMVARKGRFGDFVGCSNYPKCRNILKKDMPKSIELSSNWANVTKLFDVAKSRLQWPKIRFNLDGQQVALSVAGPTAKYPGSINITDGESFHAAKWFGRVVDGKYQPSREAPEKVVRFLQMFAENPAKMAAEYGKKTGNCCFCHKTLTTDESLSVGYGPICAENFGLPWGEVALEVVG